MFKTFLTSAILAVFFTVSAFAEEVPLKVDGAKTVTVAEAKKLFDEEALFVDARETAAWDLGRIPGAVHLDVKTEKFSKTALLEEAKLNEPVVFYCNGVKCGRSAEACKKAVEYGYKNVYYFRSGFPEWKKSGYPVE